MYMIVNYLVDFFGIPHGLLVAICLASVALLPVEFEGNDSVTKEQIEPKSNSAFHRCPAVTTFLGF